jgi:hypothetical protein
MHRPFLRAVLVAAGLCLLLSALSSWPGAAPAHAQGDPPPRPTLTPVPPTRERQSDQARPTAAPAGRITGTVIDLTTGAPAPNVAVAVGDQTVLADANGNYDRSGLPAGSYTVALILAPEQGMPAQEPVVVALAEGATVVQHLSFHSPPPAAPTPTPAAPPAALPTTGGAADRQSGALLIGIILLGLGIGLRSRQTRATK